MFKIICVLFILCFNSCSSYHEYRNIVEELEMPSATFKAPFDRVWQATLQVLKSYDISSNSVETGMIKTRWIDNTAQTNFTDSFDGKNQVKSAKFKLIVNVVKGFTTTRELTKVSLYKRQMIERDFLQGWKVLRSDNVLEKTILYRIERVLIIDNRLKKIEQDLAKKAESNFLK